MYKMNKPQNITTENTVLEQNNPQVSLVELKTRDDLKHLADLVAQWQQNPKFMRFLKETPMTRQENWRIFLREINTEKTKFFGIHLDWVADLVWFLLFHNFDKEKWTLELGFRVDPQNQSKWVCTQAVKQSLHDVLQMQWVQEIVWWHSAWNKWSFNVFKNSGFQLEKFVENQTFLPNMSNIETFMPEILVFTDDFKWRINQVLLKTPEPISLENKELITKWLETHNLSLNV